jgi:hypothetical protein
MSQIAILKDIGEIDDDLKFDEPIKSVKRKPIISEEL